MKSTKSWIWFDFGLIFGLEMAAKVVHERD